MGGEEQTPNAPQSNSQIRKIYGPIMEAYMKYHDNVAAKWYKIAHS